MVCLVYSQERARIRAYDLIRESMGRQLTGKWAEGVCVSDRECEKKGGILKKKGKEENPEIKFSAKICGLAASRAEIDKGDETEGKIIEEAKKEAIKNEAMRKRWIP